MFHTLSRSLSHTLIRSLIIFTHLECYWLILPVLSCSVELDLVAAFVDSVMWASSAHLFLCNRLTAVDGLGSVIFVL